MGMPGSRTRRLSAILTIAFWGLLALWLAYFLIYPCFLPPLQLDLRSTSAIQHDHGPFYSTMVTRFMPVNFILFEDDRALIRVAGEFQAAGDGHGYCFIDGPPKLVWSTPDGTDPRTNGRSYVMVAWDAPPSARAGAILGLGLVAALIGFTIWNRRRAETTAPAKSQPSFGWAAGGLSLDGPSPTWLRLGFIASTVLVLFCSFRQSWDRIDIGTDSISYVSSHAIRTPLYPSLISFLDRKNQPDLPRADGSITYRNADHRFLPVIHAQKLFWLASLAVLLWVLSGSINAWLLAALVWLAAWMDANPHCSQSLNLHMLMTEGINHGLILLYLAALWGYLCRPGRLRLFGLSLVLVVMMLHRPANAPFLAVVVALGVFHWARQERRQAWLVPAQLAAVVGGYVLLHCSINYYRVGYFRPHAFTGSQCLCTTLQSATAADVGIMADPELDEFLRVCVIDRASLRVPDYRSDPSGDYVNINLYQIAGPAYHRVFGTGNPWHEDDVYGRVARRLFLRHPIACLEQAAYQFGCIFWDPVLHTLCLTSLAVGALMFWKTRGFQWLFLAFLAACPFLLAVPACVIEFPLMRYRSQLYFAEVLMLPLTLVLLLDHGRCRRIPRY